MSTTKVKHMPQQTYGVIGLGAIGLGMAQSLLRAGLKTVGCNRSAGPLEIFAKGGGQTTHDAAKAAAVADVLFLALVNAAQVEEVLFGPNGAAQALKPGSLVLNCVTVKPAFARDMEQRLNGLGLLYLDAPVSGGPAQSRAGKLSIMASGAPQAFAKAETGLKAVAAVVHRLGNEAGKGSSMKAVNQLLAGVHIAAAAEAMALGLRMGLAAGDVYKVITSAAANSWMFETRMKHVVSGD